MMSEFTPASPDSSTPNVGPEEARIKTEAQLKDISDYKLEDDPSWFNRVLYFSAGVDKQLLRHCTNYDRVKAQGIGGIVLATATLAFFSGAYAFFIVFNGSKGAEISYPDVLISILAGGVWAAVIYNLDRFIVSSGGHGDGTDKITWLELGRAIPRIVMAAIIGLVISKPLELKIMESEVEAMLQVERENRKTELRAKTEERYIQDKTEIEKKIKELGQEIVAEEAKVKEYLQRRDQAKAVYDEEISSKNKRREPGPGPISAALEKGLKQAQAEYEREYKKIEPAVEEIKKEIKEATASKDELSAKRLIKLQEDDQKGDQYGGLIVRIGLAHDKFEVASTLITLLLIIIEVSPIFFKMMLSLSPIDYLTENQKRVAIAMRGIQFDHRFSRDEASGGISDLKTATYHRANVIEEMAAGSLRTQSELTRIANETYYAKMSEEIRADVDRFVVKDDKA